MAAIERGQEADVDRFIRTEHRVFTQKAAGRDHGKELRARLREQELRQVLQKHIQPLAAALDRRDAAIRELGEAVSAFPDALRVRLQEAAVAMSARQNAEQATAVGVRVSGFSPGM